MSPLWISISSVCRIFNEKVSTFFQKNFSPTPHPLFIINYLNFVTHPPYSLLKMYMDERRVYMDERRVYMDERRVYMDERRMYMDERRV